MAAWSPVLGSREGAWALPSPPRCGGLGERARPSGPSTSTPEKPHMPMTTPHANFFLGIRKGKLGLCPSSGVTLYPYSLIYNFIDSFALSVDIHQAPITEQVLFWRLGATQCVPVLTERRAPERGPWPCWAGATLWALSPWSEAKQSMTAMFSHRASTSWREPRPGRTSPFPGPRRSKSSRLRNRWWGATSQVTGSPRAFAAFISRIWGEWGHLEEASPLYARPYKSLWPTSPLRKWIRHTEDAGSRLPQHSPTPQTTLTSRCHWKSNRGPGTSVYAHLLLPRHVTNVH